MPVIIFEVLRNGACNGICMLHISLLDKAVACRLAVASPPTPPIPVCLPLTRCLPLAISSSAPMANGPQKQKLTQNATCAG